VLRRQGSRDLRRQRASLGGSAQEGGGKDPLRSLRKQQSTIGGSAQGKRRSEKPAGREPAEQELVSGREGGARRAHQPLQRQRARAQGAQVLLWERGEGEKGWQRGCEAQREREGEEGWGGRGQAQ